MADSEKILVKDFATLIPKNGDSAFMAKLFFSREKIVQTFSTLHGLIEGIQADNLIRESEVSALKHWLSEHSYLSKREPFSEIVKIVRAAVSDNILTDDEIKDIKHVCSKFMENFGYGILGNLQGLAAGIASDGELKESEWQTLKNWIERAKELKGSWPYDEIESLVTKHRSAVALTHEESDIIVHYFKDFCGFNSNRSLSHPLNEHGMAITGICAICPDIELQDKVFCITGESKKFPRKELADKIFAHGGFWKNDVSGLIDYLVVCTDGSPMWIYSCYGRKVEKAIAMRKDGHRIQIVHEFDLMDVFHDVA